MVKRRFLPFVLALPALAQGRGITIASTTSTDQSGLFGALLPAFREATGITAQIGRAHV